MSSTILVPLDGSAFAEQAIPYAQRLASAIRGHLVLAQVPQPVIYTGTEISVKKPRASADARAYLDGLAKLISRMGHDVEIALPTGDDVPGVILEEARAKDGRLIVMSTHGRSGLGRWLFGSVADEVLRRSDIPVMLVPPDCAPPWPETRPPRILVALDGSPFSERVLTPATSLAVLLNAHLVLFRVVAWPPLRPISEVDITPIPSLDDQIAEAEAYLVDAARTVEQTLPVVRIRTRVGQPPLAIVDAAEDENADLIAMATHGRGGLARAVLGSVATGTLRRAPVPIFFVRPTAEE
jgi:nucleotide-binding universal stress UspA family protein